MNNPLIVRTYYFCNENKVQQHDYKRIRSILCTNFAIDWTEEISRIRLDKTTFVVNYQIRF